MVEGSPEFAGDELAIPEDRGVGLDRLGGNAGGLQEVRDFQRLPGRVHSVTTASTPARFFRRARTVAKLASPVSSGFPIAFTSNSNAESCSTQIDTH